MGGLPRPPPVGRDDEREEAVKVKTYDAERWFKKGKTPEPDGHDDGAGGKPREDQLEDGGKGVPFWFVEDGSPEPEKEQK